MFWRFQMKATLKIQIEFYGFQIFGVCLIFLFLDINFERMWEWILSRLRRHHHLSGLDFDQCTLCQFGSIRRNGHLDGGSQFVRAKLRAKIRAGHRESHASRFCLTKNIKHGLKIHKNVSLFSTARFSHILAVLARKLLLL